MMRTFARFAAVAAAALLSGTALAQQPNPTCQRLEAQLTALDRGNADPQRADQIRRAEDTVNRQQFEVDRLVSQSRRMGCESSGFFSIFVNPPPQCGPLSRQIDQQRSTLERMQNNLERLNGGTAERAAERQSLLIALGDNNCGPQYRSAALAGQQGGFFDRLFGGNGNGGQYTPAPSGPMGGTYRTICVRTCDGFYFPISYSTTPDQFRADEQTCQHMCPAAEVQLYTYHNPGEDVSQAVSLNGRLYTELPTAFQYRKAVSAACSCRRPGESWYEALKGAGPDTTVAPGDVIVTEKNAKQLSQPRVGANGKPTQAKSTAQKNAVPAGSEPALAEAPGQVDPTKRKVRTIGPTFLPH
jgi:hypothetical protein